VPVTGEFDRRVPRPRGEEPGQVNLQDKANSSYQPLAPAPGPLCPACAGPGHRVRRAPRGLRRRACRPTTGHATV